MVAPSPTASRKKKHLYISVPDSDTVSRIFFVSWKQSRSSDLTLAIFQDVIQETMCV